MISLWVFLLVVGILLIVLVIGVYYLNIVRNEIIVLREELRSLRDQIGIK